MADGTGPRPCSPSMATYLFVSSLQPTVSARIAAEAVDPIDLCVTSPSEDAHATASAARNGHFVFTVDEPLLAARVADESVGDVMARYAQALRVIAADGTRSALVVCDELDVLGRAVVTMDESALLETAEAIERRLPLPSCATSSLTAEKISVGSTPRATSVATRRSAACSSTSRCTSTRPSTLAAIARVSLQSRMSLRSAKYQRPSILTKCRGSGGRRP